MGAATKQFKYEGINREGKKVSGEMDAVDIAEVKKVLRRSGIRTSKIQAPSMLDMDLNQLIGELVGAKGFSDKDLSRFTNQLSTLIDAGVPIVQSMEILYKQEKSIGLKRAIKSVAKQVSEGKSLHDAMTETGAFDRLFCYMIKAGESAGIIDQILARLSAFLEKKQALKKKVKSAMTYPAIVTVVGIGVVTFLLAYVVPMFVDMIKESKQEIPAITQFVMDVSEFIQNYFLLMLGGGIAGAIGIAYALKTPQGRAVYDELMLKLPIFKDLTIKSNLSTMTQTLSTLIAAGIPILDALDICVDTIDNGIIAKDIAKVRVAVAGGKNMTDPLKRVTYFPPLITQMIEVGESTGKLESMLHKVSKIFEIEVEGAIQTITSLIEPLILVVLGGTIAVVLVAMYLPIFMSAGGAGVN
jgi:type IV pilus assembly protein PilC